MTISIQVFEARWNGKRRQTAAERVAERQRQVVEKRVLRERPPPGRPPGVGK